MGIDFNQYINLFVEEGKEHLQSMNEALLELEKDKNNTSLINKLFRAAHTLKGMSGTMGYTNMADLTHEMENVLEYIRSGRIELDDDLVDIIFECLDALYDSINEIAENKEEVGHGHKNLMNRLYEFTEGSYNNNRKKETNKSNNLEVNEYVLNAIGEAIELGLNTLNIKIRLSPKCMLKSARSFIIFNTLESTGDIIYSNPPVEDIEDEKFDLEFSIIYITKLKAEVIEEKLNNIFEIDEVSITEISDIMKTDPASNKTEKEILIGNIDKLNSTEEDIVSSSRETKIGKTVRVDIDRLDNLMNLVSELIIIKTRMDDLSDISNKENMIEAIEYLERITTNLHDAVMKVRMVPIERVFNRFPRMVRDLSKELKKIINLQMNGEETEVDRTVIDEIGDPLIHIIRNSIDHGIEAPDERRKLNKAEEGTVILEAYPDGNNVVIEVLDDGRGIDIEIVKEKAIEREAVTSQEAEILSDSEVMDLLFQPGFTTSDSISDVSGRGVGLDVVKSKIESINGSIEIISEKNMGTKFIIRIPLTLAIIQALLIRLEDEIYAIPLSSVTEITNIEKQNIRNIQGQDMVVYRGKTISVVRLHKLMDIESVEEKEEYTVVIVRKGEKQVALLVDNLIGQQEIVIKPLGKYLNNTKYLSGATILGNGNISLILDVNSII